jgi:transposase
MRIIGLDIHRAFAEAVAWDDGKLERLGRVDIRRHLLEAFAKKLSKEDVVVVEATGNAASVASVIAPHVKKVVIANSKQVRIIAHAKIKTDTIDASVLAQLYASGFLPEVWIPDEPTQALRRQVTRRNQIVRQRSRLKNIIQSILHSHLIPSCPHADLCGARGRAWLFHQNLPEDERLAVERHLREFDRLGEDLKVIERDLARSALGDEGVKRLMTIPGVDMVVALAIVAAIGDVGRFEQSQKLVSYLGLNPSVRQSGPGPAYHGRITKQGRGHARGMLVEAAWAAARAPGPLRAFFLRVRARRGQHVAAVATARKLAVIIWHLLRKGESYAWARPALHARKLRDLELKAGYKAERGQRGAAYAYNIKSHRDQERRWVEQAETAYAASLPAGTRVAPSGRAQAPQMRSDNEGCAAGLAPHALLFAARSPVRQRKIAQILPESTCRSHQWSRDAWAWSAGDRRRSGRRRLRRRARGRACVGRSSP